MLFLSQIRKSGVLFVAIYLGDIDIELYRRFFPDIHTSEVVITDERMQHVKEGHPEVTDADFLYLPKVITCPDYIFSDPAPNTVRLMKSFYESGKCFRAVVKISICEDNKDYKNSVLTFISISEKRYNRYVRKDTILFTNL